MIRLGKYRLIAALGRGGMADVNLAMIVGPAGSRFSKLAVVKRLRIAEADDPEFVTMLVDEARITANLRHPNVVQMLEVNVHEGKPFLAMEYLDGMSLRHLRRLVNQRGVPFPRESEYAVILDVLAGLHHAHELRGLDGTHLAIVHRDVTPHNVFVTVDGLVKVLDFGIAKAIGSASVTQHGMVKGKIRYMAPEQARGLALDRRADIFSVGIMLWEAATRRRFWEDHPPEGIGRALTEGRYCRSPREVDPTLPEAIDAICRRALAFDPAERYATAEEFRAELEDFLGDGIIQARRQLGPLVQTLSEDARARLRAVIEAAAADMEPLSSRDTGALKAVSLPVADQEPPVEATKVMPGRPLPPKEIVAPAPVPVATATPKTPPARRPTRFVEAVAASVLSVSIVVVAVLSIARVGPVASLAGRDPATPTVSRRPLEVRSVPQKVSPPAVVSHEKPTNAATKSPKGVALRGSAPRGGTKRVESRATPAAGKSGNSELKLDTNDPWSGRKGDAPR